MLKIEFKDVGFHYGGRWVFRGLNFKYEGAGVVSVVGSSGSGKTTLLKLVAGLLQPHEGEICCSTQMLGWVPQDVGLLPWMTLGENVSLPLRFDGGMPAAAQYERVRFACKSLGIENLIDSLPKDVSGGEAQRAAIARAIAAESQLILMDEPFSALDNANVEVVIRLLWNEFVELNEGLSFISSHKSFESFLPRHMPSINLDNENVRNRNK